MRYRWTALLFSPVGLLLLSSARLIIISDFNATTATTVAASGGYVNTLLGSVIPLLPVFIPYVALLLLLFRNFVLSIIAFVFTVFVTPTSLQLPVTLRFARSDEHQLLAWFNGDRYVTIFIAVFIGIAALIYTGSFAEAVATLVIAAVTLALLLMMPIRLPPLPPTLYFVGTTEQQIVSLLINDRTALAIVLLLIFIIWVWVALDSGGLPSLNLAMALTTFVAVLATLALLPYISNFYPLPGHRSYYVEVLRAPWLPAEKIRMSTGLVYNGYVLSTDNGWFIVLLAHERRIVYLPANDVVERTVCQTSTPGQPPQRKPLIPLFYVAPPRLPACPSRRDIYASRMSILSQGQSLNVISFLVHVAPTQIIAETNAYQHDRLSVALRRYENIGDWNAPTPSGQHFWYYPPI